MAVQTSAVLPPAPPNVLSPDGRPRFGAYEGSVRIVDLDTTNTAGIHGRLRKLAKAKRWTWAGVATEEVLFGCAIVDLGYAGTGFYYAVDLRNGGVLAQGSFPAIPGVTLKVNDRPGEGARASLWAPNGHLRVHRAEGTPAYQLEVRTGDLRLEALLDTGLAPPPLSLVTKVVGGPGAAFTQKSNLLASAGTLRIGDRRWNLGNGFGGLDYTQGILARRTVWRWAFACGKTTDGTPVGINLAEGNYEGESTENALWIGREVFPLSRPRFSFDPAKPNEAWEVRTEDDAVNLRLTPKGQHGEKLELLVVRSRFVQVAGLFSGTIRDGSGRTHTIEDVPGVAENQNVVW